MSKVYNLSDYDGLKKKVKAFLKKVLHRLFIIPSSRNLEKHWWHRLAQILILIWILWCGYEWVGGIKGLMFGGKAELLGDYFIEFNNRGSSTRVFFGYHGEDLSISEIMRRWSTLKTTSGFWLLFTIISVSSYFSAILAGVMYRLVLNAVSYIGWGKHWAKVLD